MKYFKFKKNNACIYNCEKLYINEEDAHKENKGGFFSCIPEYKQEKCKSIEELRNLLFDYEFRYDVSKDFYQEAWKIVDEVIEKIGVETFNINYPNTPCIIVKCNSLSDQYECDADRTPIEYLNSAKELENKEYNFNYEVYLIKENGLLKYRKDLSTY